MSLGLTEPLSAQNYIETIISTIKSYLPPSSEIKWNGNSYTILTSLNSNELDNIFNIVSRNFGDKNLPIHKSRPVDWVERGNYDLIVWLSNSENDLKDNQLPTFCIGESFLGSRNKQGYSLNKYTFIDKPIIRCDKLAAAFELFLGNDSKVFWNGRGYTIKTNKNVEKNEQLSKFFRKAIFSSNKPSYGEQTLPLTFNGERVINADGTILPGFTLYEQIPMGIRHCK